MITKRISNDYLGSNQTVYDFYEICITDKLLEDKDTLDSFLFDCQCVLFLIDITDKESFNKVKQLITTINFSEYTILKKILLENKIDIENRREIDSEEINNFIKEKNIEDKVPISIKEGQGLEELIEKIKKYTNGKDIDIPINYITQEKNELNNSNLNLEKNLSFILIGDSNVGKTCFYTRFQNNKFQENFLSTIGIDKNIKYFKYKGEECKIILWDTAGQDRFKSLTKKYYQNANGIFLFYDVTNKESFNDVSVWMNDINDNTKFEGPNGEKIENGKNKITVYLIGNKIDKLERVISKEEAEEKASFYGIKYFEISCKLNMNIAEISSRMIDDCILKLDVKEEKKEEQEVNQNKNGSFSLKNVKNKNKENNKKTCC